ncbi:bis(5'-nucleosyl)-tetraphosphatase (symmetrical) YqeK [Fusibacter paucivorans]|uniref:bis(5'-nucleosyl)-tetraphosphatase (symmetrical) n=1 Tax=Fusibacter paucivorans TaxID=76009 RepID=A0ABS5PP25_9FIRM|nr:bis(5'-nucleosyl)-tetraphosphatase (symmetrical) YqeK [Fusibacter paucivorans]MBS7526818.1 bis(5'-nucleosyl)-tetraphosphatase (symmetrical) YqeK [Fusibacter paucivorans]
MTNEAMITYLKANLSKKRFQHSMRVAKLSKDLAKIHGADPDKAYFAGLVHDIAKELDDETCLLYIQKANIYKDPSIEANPNLAHGEIAAYLLSTKFGIDDESILNAVRWHTYGRANMTTLDKIVYLADIIEPKRQFEHIDDLRKIVVEDLNAAIHYFFDLCVAYLSEKHQIVHQNTYDMLHTLR